MTNHPIEGLMNTAMSNLREMIDVNTIVGDAIETINGTIIIWFCCWRKRIYR